MPHLQFLNLDRTSVDTVEPLADHPSVCELHLGDTEVIDLTPFASLPKLRTLHLSDYNSDLEQCPQLTHLYLYETYFEDGQLEDIGAALPNLRFLRIPDLQEYWGFEGPGDDDYDDDDGLRIVNPYILDFKQRHPKCTLELFED